MDRQLRCTWRLISEKYISKSYEASVVVMGRQEVARREGWAA